MPTPWLKRMACLLPVILASVPSAAATVPLLLEYAPSQAREALRVSVRNPSDYCGQEPCAANVDAARLFDYRRIAWFYRSASIYLGFMLRLPAPRTVQLVSDSGATLQLKLTFLGSYLGVNTDYPLHPALNNNVNAGCSQRRTLGAPPAMKVNWMLDAPGTSQLCRFALRESTDNYSVIYSSELEGIYQAELLPGQQPANGMYRGQALFTVGQEGTDFQVGQIRNGDGYISTSSVGFDITLTVNPALAVRLPEGDEVSLMPPGGQSEWNRWSQWNQVPTHLEGRVPFELDSNGPFRVSYRCGTVSADGRCTLTGQYSGNQHPYEVALAWNTPVEIAPGYTEQGTPNGNGRTFGYVPTLTANQGAFNLRVEDPAALQKARDRLFSGPLTLIVEAGL